MPTNIAKTRIIGDSRAWCKNNWNDVQWETTECEEEGLSLASKNVGDDEDELESDDLYSKEDLTLNSLGHLRWIQPWSDRGDVWKEHYGNNMRIIGKIWE